MLRKLCLILSMLLILSVVGGCTQSQQPSAPPEPDPADTQEEVEQPKEVKSDYPKDTITILVPFSAGGGADLMARGIQPVLQEKLGVNIVVENKPGANGGIAMSELSRRKADGYTIILTTTGPSTIAPNLADIGYTKENFKPICQVADVPTVISVHSESGITTLDQLLEKGRANPGSVTYGTSGAGSTHNLGVEALLLGIEETGILSHVSFEGGSQAITALLGQQIDASATILTEAAPHADVGTFNILGIGAEERSNLIPDVPTFKEQGYDVTISTWYGFAAPAGTPDDIIELLNNSIKESVEDPRVITIFENVKTPVQHLNSDDFEAKWNASYETNAKVIDKLGYK